MRPSASITSVAASSTSPTATIRPAVDPHVGRPSRRAGAVNDETVADDGVQHESVLSLSE